MKSNFPVLTRVGILCHPTNPNGPDITAKLLSWAARRSIKIFMEPPMARKIGRPETGYPRREIGELVELVIVLGGDGSILEAVRAFARGKIPVAGINLGHLGFLTLGSLSEAEEIAEKLYRGEFEIEERSMIRALVKRNGREVYCNIALNDFTIVKEPISRVIELDVSISGTYVNSFRGDGVIIATPTGSTAYSLSAGGPIIPPWVDAMLITPICPHTLNAKPVITSDKAEISAIIRCSHSQVDLVTDGQEGFRVHDGDMIEIHKAPNMAKIVVFEKRAFFNVLREKMKWGK
ncbi:MAG: NAD(+)/NADH kinase [Candidatus Riflebacteria bacterium]|nr:NAD(+)/NADH kinase [Candidatus Riflebacteria bacterium]